MFITFFFLVMILCYSIFLAINNFNEADDKILENNVFLFLDFFSKILMRHILNRHLKKMFIFYMLLRFIIFYLIYFIKV